jgi:hypothetical protein
VYRIASHISRRSIHTVYTDLIFPVIPFDAPSVSRVERDPNVVEWGSNMRERRPLAYKHLGVLGLMHVRPLGYSYIRPC